ncbi:hypothetical protein BP5796_05202 [Coleophoma crateriformis]|uniref:MARVEL domain-containing protein n=1 Tax=Coleophoma crateriformis TaxID=565419 RepID=A0A3D8S353_9HELO|nr:hypothetical protein BP5796_05202 [Coleophoma crateriformis]
MARKHQRYQTQPMATLWSRKTLLILWFTQISVSLFCSVFTAICYPLKANEDRADDGLSFAFYVVLAFQVFAYTILSLGLTLLQMAQYWRGDLSPKWLLVPAWCTSVIWLATGIQGVSYAATSTLGPFTVFEVVMVLDVLVM